MRWGYIPAWSKEKPKVRPINARDDNVATSGLFRTAFKRHRCLVPADGWYEWKAITPKKKQPYLFELNGGEVFAFAGIWDAWKESSDADPVLGFATITTTPNRKAAEIHNRIPVILPAAVWDRWLDPEFQDADALVEMLKPIPDGINIRPVNPAMGNVKFEGPECIAPPPPESTAVASDEVPKKPGTRKPRAKKGSDQDADLFNS